MWDNKKEMEKWAKHFMQLNIEVKERIEVGINEDGESIKLETEKCIENNKESIELESEKGLESNKESIRLENEKNLKDKLIEFRRIRSKEKNIPA